jgi:hypothetical protein
MKSEAEIRAKLNYYEGMLAGFMAGCNVDRPDVFLAVEQTSPGEALATLSLTNKLAGMIRELPPEDQKGLSEALGDYVRQLQRFLEDRITILKWVLDEKDVPGGGGGC